MAIESVVSKCFLVDLFGVVVKVQTVMKKVMGTNLHTK
jgi:hypothetical protein